MMSGSKEPFRAQDMKFDDAIYRLTDTGEAALGSVDTAIPVDYRRILCLIDGDTHVNVVRARLRRYSDKLIADWLDELKEIGFVESVESGKAQNLDLEELVNSGLAFRALGELPDEQRQIDVEATSAGIALKGKGVYLATARLQN